MSKKEYDVPIEGHEYDGIQELNNPLPKWWLATFYGTIIFGVIYFGYFVLGPGPSHEETLNKRMASINKAYAQTAEEMHAATADVDAEAVMNDPEAMAVGKAQFTKTCVVCHGPNGEGLIGPNLCDKYWIHGKGDMPMILKSIREGYPEKGMPPWGQMIPQDEQVPLAAYVMSLQGTNPPNPKEPQGELVEE